MFCRNSVVVVGGGMNEKIMDLLASDDLFQDYCRHIFS